MFIFGLFPLLKITIFGLICWSAGLVYFINSIPEIATKVKNEYDVIIVLTGGQNRIPYAMDLLKGGKGEILFISGVADEFSTTEFERNLPPALKSRIFYGDKARSTIGNAEETNKWLEQRKAKKLLIVTANYHLPRTKLLFNHYLPNYKKYYAAVVPPDFKLNEWLTHENSRRLVFSEYNKLLATWLQLLINGNSKASK